MAGTRTAALAGCLSAALLQAGPAPAQSGNAERGAALAQAWCVGCHIVDRAGAGTVRDAAPTFAAVAADPARTPDYLRGWLQSGRLHVQMPNFSLGRRDTEDLIAYFRTLARE